VRKLVLISVCLFLAGCQPIEKTVRDIHSGAAGFLRKAQDNHLQECLDFRDRGIDLGKSAAICPAINKGAAAQRLLGDALNLYCAGPGYLAETEPCLPQLALRSKLEQALAVYLRAERDLNKLGAR